MLYYNIVCYVTYVYTYYVISCYVLYNNSNDNNEHNDDNNMMTKCYYTVGNCIVLYSIVCYSMLYHIIYNIIC